MRLSDHYLLDAFKYLTRDELDDPLHMVSRQFTRVLSSSCFQSAPLRLVSLHRQGSGVAWLKLDNERLAEFISLLQPPTFAHD